MDEQQVREVQHYYDTHTPGFLRSGHGAAAYAIHRAVWAPGVQSLQEAIEYPNACILAALRAQYSQTVLDLGCGVGGTLRYLAARHPAQYGGLTISPVQLAMGAGVGAGDSPMDHSSITLHSGDFHDPKAVQAFFGPQGADVAFGIESFLHSDAPERFFAAVAAALRPAGTLILIDDFLVSGYHDEPGRGGAAERTLQHFQIGWRTGALRTVAETIAIAARSGFELESTTDLTPHLQLGRPRDRVFDLIAPVLRTISVRRFGFITGGVALQKLLRHNVLAYNVLILRQREEQA